MKNTVVIFVLISLFACESKDVKRDRFFIQGNEALKLRDYDKAVDYYTRALNLDKDFSRAYNNRGVAHVENGHPYEGIQDYNMAISLQDDYVDAIFNRAYAYEQVGRIEDALEDVSEVQRIFPDSAYVYFYQGLLETKGRQYELAMKSFRKAAELEPYDEETEINLATLYFFKGDLDSAKIILKNVLKTNPGQSSALNTISQVYLAESDFQNALITINQALKLEPSEPYFLNNRGQVYLEMDSLNLAIEDINNSILLDPENPWSYRNKGVYYLKKGEPDQAIRLLETVVDQPVFVDEVHAYLGAAYLAKGEKLKACESWLTGIDKHESKSLEYYEANCE